MTISFPLAMDNWDDRETQAIARTIKSNRLTMGQNVKTFEREVAAKFGSRFAVMVNSGSSANLLMLTALKISRVLGSGPRKNIIVPALSWSTTFTPAYFLDFELRFVDIDEGHFGISDELISSAIDENTIAILAVNILGSACNLNKLSELADKNRIWLLEDNCESLGASISGRHTGSVGKMATHSSFYSHHLNTMEGGWITTDDEDLYDILRSLRAHGWTRELPATSKLRTSNQVDDFEALFEFVLPGLNFRPLEIEASIGLVQLEKFDDMLSIRRSNATHFIDLFKSLEGVRIQTPIGESSWFAFALVFENRDLRNRVATLLQRNGVECRPIITGNFTRQEALNHLHYKIYSTLPVADTLHDCGLYVGNHPVELKHELTFTYNLISNFLSQESDV
jgi:CDP-6-deoxy-D-xylo-4-hexulose-3-dehydrase